MTSKNLFGNNFLSVIVIVILSILAVLPVIFYFSKATKNPAEFNAQEKRYITIEGKVRDISPAVLSLVKVDDIQKDYNGEENARIISILKVEPQVFGKADLGEGKSVAIVSDKKDLYVALRIRYDRIGEEIVLHPTTIKLRVGNSTNLEFPDYFINLEITKVNKP